MYLKNIQKETKLTYLCAKYRNSSDNLIVTDFFRDIKDSTHFKTHHIYNHIVIIHDSSHFLLSKLFFVLWKLKYSVDSLIRTSICRTFHITRTRFWSIFFFSNITMFLAKLFQITVQSNPY